MTALTNRSDLIKRLRNVVVLLEARDTEMWPACRIDHEAHAAYLDKLHAQLGVTIPDLESMVELIDTALTAAGIIVELEVDTTALDDAMRRVVDAASATPGQVDRLRERTADITRYVSQPTGVLESMLAHPGTPDDVADAIADELEKRDDPAEIAALEQHMIDNDGEAR